MIKVHGFSPSGNCHKVKLLLEQLGRDYAWIETDSARGATRTPEYLAKNPNGKVPMLELEDGRVLVESNAILCWLAEGTPPPAHSERGHARHTGDIDDDRLRLAQIAKPGEVFVH